MQGARSLRAVQVKLLCMFCIEMLALPCPALHGPALSCIAMPCAALPCPDMQSLPKVGCCCICIIAADDHRSIPCCVGEQPTLFLLPLSSLHSKLKNTDTLAFCLGCLQLCMAAIAQMTSYADCNMLVCREYHGLTMISTSIDCVSLMTPMLLLTPQISLLLQSMLHMEVVLGMSLSEHGLQSSPMLQRLLTHADRYSITAVMLQL